jgi:hypothetical protein
VAQRQDRSAHRAPERSRRADSGHIGRLAPVAADPRLDPVEQPLEAELEITLRRHARLDPGAERGGDRRELARPERRLRLRRQPRFEPLACSSSPEPSSRSTACPLARGPESHRSADLRRRPHARLVFGHLDISVTASHALAPRVTWWGWHVSALLEVGIVFLMGLAMVGIAIWEFSATE